MPRVRVSIEEQAAISEGIVSIVEGEGTVQEAVTVYVTEGSSADYVTEDGQNIYIRS